MKTLMLEVNVVDTVEHITIEVMGTWPRISSPSGGKAFARRRIDRVDLRNSRRSAVDTVVHATGAACEDVMRQIIEQEGT